MAINLKTVNEVIRITTDGTEAIDVVASYADWVSGTPFVPSGKVTLITTATTTNIVEAPGASTVRMINSISITNTSATSANVIVNLYDGTNDHEMGTFDIGQDESIVYAQEYWRVLPAGDSVRGFIAGATTNQSDIANDTYTKVQFNDETWDSHAEYDDVTNFRYTPQKAGMYLFNAAMLWGDIDDTNYTYIALYLNGVEKLVGWASSPGSASITNPKVSGQIRLNGTTDYVEVYAKHTNGDATPDMYINGATNAFFHGVWVSD